MSEINITAVTGDAGANQLMLPGTLYHDRNQWQARRGFQGQIEHDGKDPHFLANLSRIGQVNVQGSLGKTHDGTLDQLSQMYRTRDLAQQQAVSADRPARNKLLASAVSGLLDDRKLVGCSRGDLERLAKRYAVDRTVLENLARFVNTPSVGEGTVSQTVGDDGQERVRMQAVWIEPALKDLSK